MNATLALVLLGLGVWLGGAGLFVLAMSWRPYRIGWRIGRLARGWLRRLRTEGDPSAGMAYPSAVYVWGGLLLALLLLAYRLRDGAAG